MRADLLVREGEPLSAAKWNRLVSSMSAFAEQLGLVDPTGFAVRRLATRKPPTTKIFRLLDYRLDTRPFWPAPAPVAWFGLEVRAVGGDFVGQPTGDPFTVHALRWPFTDLAGVELPLTRYLPQIPIGDQNGFSDVPVIELPIDPTRILLYTWEQEMDPPPTSRLYVAGLFTGYCL